MDKHTLTAALYELVLETQDGIYSFEEFVELNLKYVIEHLEHEEVLPSDQIANKVAYYKSL